MSAAEFLKQRSAPLRRVIGGLRRRVLAIGERRALVLLYHRVTTLDADPQLLSVRPDRFAEHLEIARSLAEPLSLDELARGIRKGGLPKRSFVVTFDDGYADNFREALPVLRTANVPAAFFIASGYVQSQREFWWDDVERIVLREGRAPASEFALAGPDHQPLRFDGAAAATDRAPIAGWDVTQTRAAPRQALYRSLCESLKPLHPEQRMRALEDLGRAFAAPERMRRSHAVLDPTALREFAADPLVTIGAHTIRHPMLSRLAAEDQRQEIEGSRQDLEAWLDRSVQHFAYPFGTPEDYNADSRNIVAELGFESACSNFPGIARRGADPYQIPRVLVRDWTADVFREFFRRSLRAPV